MIPKREPARMTSPSAPDDPPPNTGNQVPWVTQLRAMHRTKRLIGMLGCLAGVLLMLFGRFRPDIAPSWMLPAGLVVVGLSWALFAWVIYDRWRWVKANPYKPER